MLLLVAVAGGGLQAQARPSTDVWVVPMHQTGGEVHFGEPRNASKRTGYDNQPGFTPDGRAVLYTVIGDDGQADIWRYPLSGGRPRRITVTRESEYSATATPDGRGFSVIRVEADSTQRLWRFPLSGFGAPSLVLERIKPVGYHVWVGDHALVLFVLGRPATLQLADDASAASILAETRAVDGLERALGINIVIAERITRDHFGEIAVAFREHALRNPDAQMDAGINLRHYIECAQMSERAGLDFLFFADSAAVRATITTRAATSTRAKGERSSLLRSTSIWVNAGSLAFRLAKMKPR